MKEIKNIENMLLQHFEDDKDAFGKINQSVDDIKIHLVAQDKLMIEMKSLLEEREFILKLWKFVKALCAILVATAGALLVYKQLEQ